MKCTSDRYDTEVVHIICLSIEFHHLTNTSRVLSVTTFAVASRRSTCCPSGTREWEKARFESYPGKYSNVVNLKEELNYIATMF